MDTGKWKALVTVEAKRIVSRTKNMRTHFIGMNIIVTVTGVLVAGRLFLKEFGQRNTTTNICSLISSFRRYSLSQKVEMAVVTAPHLVPTSKETHSRAQKTLDSQYS
mmetsp:Transcript_5416/g.15717  ORF Transcript_5416/g.15717 Transcript_5416/m.15717 type:complete len:107 (+) Transcript_5416:899-1219(+)